MFYEDSHCFYQEIIRMKQIEIFSQKFHIFLSLWGFPLRHRKRTGRKAFPVLFDALSLCRNRRMVHDFFSSQKPLDTFQEGLGHIHNPKFACFRQVILDSIKVP